MSGFTADGAATPVSWATGWPGSGLLVSPGYPDSPGSPDLPAIPAISEEGPAC